MAKLFNRAKMTTTTTGTGTITLGSASNGFQSFADAGVANGDVVQYVIEEGSNFEIGTGTYTSSGTTLTRSPTESSNSDAAITLAGQATVSITAVAADMNRLQHNGSDKVTVSSTGASVTGNISVTGTVDGRDIATDGSKLDGIESGATADQTAAEIRAKVEAASDSNVFTDADHTKLNGIAANANNYSLPLASSSTRGGVKVGYTENGKNYPVELSNEQMYVNVPWTDTDTNTTYSAGSGLSLSGTTFSHTDTSSQGSVNNSGGTVIQDVTLDTYGHVTGLTSYNLDSRYYTETEADSRFVNVTGDTMTAPLTIDTNTGSMLKLQATNSGPWAIELGRDDATNSKVFNGGGYWAFEHRPKNYDGGSYHTLFDDGYHPNADKWTTARTLSLSGDASGSVSWDGSANATLSVDVGNANSVDGYSVSTTRNSANTIPVRDGNGYLQLGWINTTSGATTNTITKIYGTYGSDSYIRYFTPATLISQQGIWTSSNDGSGSGLDADLLDGVQGSSYLRSDQNDTMSGQLTVTSTNDAQILLQSTDSWTGIGFNDSGSNNDYIWHYGGSGTFAIGGGGSTVSGKRLHVHGSMTVGDGYATTSPYTNGLTVQGNISTAGNYYAPNQIIHTGDTDTYIQFHAADQWRVVTGGTERLEVNNSAITAVEPIRLNSSTPFWENKPTVSANYTITDGYNAMSAGPITINSGVTVTVGDGEAWTVV